MLSILIKLLEKQKNIQVLNKQIFGIYVHLQSLKTQKNLGIWAISNISHEINNQQHRIARRKSVFASNNSCLLSYGNIKSRPFSITTNKVGKRKAVPFSEEISPCAKVKRCNETYDVYSLIHAGCKDNKVSVLKGMLETVGRKFSSTDVVTELNNGKNAITRRLSLNFINFWHNNFYESNEIRIRSLMGETKI